MKNFEGFGRFLEEDYSLVYPEVSPEATFQEVDSIESLLGISPPARILDVGCGYGRHGLELARRGYEVVGIDTSIYLIRRAQEKASSEGLQNIQFILADMRELAFKEDFDAVINVFTSFGYFDDSECEDVIRRIWEALKPGGKFLLDLINRNHMMLNFRERDWWHPRDGVTVLVAKKWDWQRARLHITTVVQERGKEERAYRYWVRVFAPNEVVRFLERAGFTEMRFYGSLSGETFNWRMSPKVVVVAKKP